MLEALRKLQQDRALTDGQMAASLGVHRSQWNLMKNGHRPLTHDVAVKAAGAWPELTRHLLDIAQASASAVPNTPKVAA